MLHGDAITRKRALTWKQKAQAVAHFYYLKPDSALNWTPRAGEHYTTHRADREMWLVVSIEGINTTVVNLTTDHERTYTYPNFVLMDFHRERIPIPAWILRQRSRPHDNT